MKKKLYILPQKNSWQYLGAILGSIFLIGFGIFLLSIVHWEVSDITRADIIPFSIILCGILLGYGYFYIHKIEEKTKHIEFESIYDQDKIKTYSIKDYVIANSVRTISIIILGLVALNILENIRDWIDEKPLQVIIILLGIITIGLYRRAKDN